jgi:hypothetical protein
MKIKWSIVIPWIAVGLSLIIIIFIATIPKSIDDNMVYLNPRSGILDHCNSGGVNDSNGQYLDANKCYAYVGQKVSDVKRDAGTHGPNVKWVEMPVGSPNPNNTTNKNSCHKRSDNDTVAAVSVHTPDGGANSACWLYSDSEVQLVYSEKPNLDGGIGAKYDNSLAEYGSAYDKRYAAINL